MQEGEPPKVDTSDGALAGSRAWGDCYVPQTLVERGHATDAGT